ncbi:Succinate dehydrogenase flavin-adding protein, antitoxin component of the CptAB toxin-antitoxin module [Mariprofundus aestuarium]|uniref:FAD assembly factor SdhE n=1 Tax=Mariprofundus aestuarium TaxID=1921086 RepID=A0A2K8KX10_MARES|nr:succinate dehydrogenase assembly factor 2 [Mariprofundus aestuarium]ATX79383.1 Succinate dehydrogenase flavin-adding protein, antitoxin component of the CptAB toxin-antitoxin module [Mariprofundus aestuarium]
MVKDTEVNLRRMRYRLNRQGMLELDAWLSPLLDANTEDEKVASAIETLLQCEAPQLQSMMMGQCEIPEALEKWLCR